MLSLHTNSAALSTENSLAATQSSLNTSLTRLGSGYRVNSAMDDAAGLQIATRLESQTEGLTQAQSNTADGISMLQTADGGLAEASNILLRMKDLATQAATASSSTVDDAAMQVGIRCARHPAQSDHHRHHLRRRSSVQQRYVAGRHGRCTVGGASVPDRRYERGYDDGRHQRGPDHAQPRILAT